MDAESSQTHSNKRARTVSETSEESLEQYEPWWDDGNIIIIAENKKFRVHRSIIAAHSVVFKDMLCVGQSEQELMDGCPFVRLHDSAKDLRHALKALYNQRFVIVVFLSLIVLWN
jgi:BTB/POZ domain